MVGALMVAQAQNKPHQLKVINRSAVHPYIYSSFSGVVTPHFQGNDLQKITEGLSAVYAVKGEFETSAKYDERIERARASPLTDGIGRNDTLAFVFPTDRGEKSLWASLPAIVAKYDADAGAMTVSVKLEGTKLDRNQEDFDSPSIIWNEKSAPTIHYAASNAFGATAEVSAFTDTQYGVAFPLDGYSGAMEYSGLFVTFPVDAGKAQLLSKRLRALVICAVATDSPVSEGHDYSSATFETSSTSDITYRYLHIKPTELWVFDSETGEVLGKSKDVFQKTLQH